MRDGPGISQGEERPGGAGMSGLLKDGSVIALIRLPMSTRDVSKVLGALEDVARLDRCKAVVQFEEPWMVVKRAGICRKQ